MRVLSLGWGVQSFTLAVMAALGDVEPIDYAPHVDTLHEQKATYDFAQRFTPWLAERGVKVATVQNPTGGFWEVTKRPGQTHVPAFTLNVHGETGMLNRSCTHRWKIVPIRRWLQAHRNGEPIEQWIGISTDEALRMKPSDVKYITHRWPLIEKKMSRKDCEKYLSAHGLEIPPKSACVFCPFHDTSEWRKSKQCQPTGAKPSRLMSICENCAHRMIYLSTRPAIRLKQWTFGRMNRKANIAFGMTNVPASVACNSLAFQQRRAPDAGNRAGNASRGRLSLNKGVLWLQ